MAVTCCCARCAVRTLLFMCLRAERGRGAMACAVEIGVVGIVVVFCGGVGGSRQREVRRGVCVPSRAEAGQ